MNKQEEFDEYMSAFDKTQSGDELEEEEIQKSPKRGRGRPRKESSGPPPSVATSSSGPSAKDLKDIEKKKEAELKASLFKEISLYLENEIISQKLPPSLTVSEKDTLELLLKKRAMIKEALSGEFYRQVVYNAFDKTCLITENTMLAYMNMPQAAGFHKEIRDNHEYFDIELEEISLQLQSMYQPPAWLRLMMKMSMAMETVIERNSLMVKHGLKEEVNPETYSKVPKKSTNEPKNPH